MRALAVLLFSVSSLAVTSACQAGDQEIPQAADPVKKGQAEAIFAAGCFWCSEKDFEKVPGVIEVESGYTGGTEQHPTYYQVGSGATGHTEAVRVVFDPSKVSYDELLDYYWHHVDPFDAGGQFCDRGSQYRPAILPVNAEQRAAAGKSRVAIAALFGKPVAVQLETPGTFWVAEAHHQNFYKTNPAHYNRYRTGCGRDRKVQAIWKQVGGAH